MVPAFNTTEDVQICAGQTYTLPDGTTVSADGSYPVTLVTAGGCDSTITTNVTVVPAFTTTNDVQICTGQTYTLPDGTVVGPGLHTVTLSSLAGCDSTIHVLVSVSTPIASFAWYPGTVSMGASVILGNTSTGAASYLWQFSDGSTSNETSPNHPYSVDSGSELTVCLVASSTAGCSDTVCQEVSVPSTSVHVPNAFTPDGDDINDVFLPIMPDAQPKTYRFEIYDRWGQLLFEANKPGVAWDGRFTSGEEVPIGVYVWKLYLDFGTSVIRKEWVGHVTLVR